MNKDSFVLFLEFKDVFDNLSDEDAGKLIKAVFGYEATKIVPPLEQLLSIAFIPIKNSLDRNSDKYQRIVERNRENGRRGGRPKKNDDEKPKNPMGNLGNPKKPKKADSDSDREHDSDYDNEFFFKEQEENKEDVVVEEKNIFEFIEQNFGRTLAPVEYEKVILWQEEFKDDEIIKLAIKESVFNRATNFNYVQAILNNWKGKTLIEIKNNEIGKYQKMRKESDEAPKELFDYDWLNETEEE